MQDRIRTKERGSTAMQSPSTMDRLTGLAKAKAGELLGHDDPGNGRGDRTASSPPADDVDDLHDEGSRSTT